MSVQALSPFSGSKRLFEEHPEDTDSPCDRGGSKRGRFLPGSPSGRCSGQAAFPAVPVATLNALRGLFPGMDDQVGTPCRERGRGGRERGQRGAGGGAPPARAAPRHRGRHWAPGPRTARHTSPRAPADHPRPPLNLPTPNRP
jgi:hypothetical protein